MEFSRQEFRPIIRGLHVIRRHDESPRAPYKLIVLDDPEFGPIGLDWIVPTVGAIAMKLLDFKSPRPVEYGVMVDDLHSEGVTTHFTVNPFGHRNTIFKNLIDTMPLSEWSLERAIEADKLTNQLGLNEMTREDVLWLQSLVARQVENL
jgi:hypothetical protein